MVLFIQVRQCVMVTFDVLYIFPYVYKFVDISSIFEL